MKKVIFLSVLILLCTGGFVTAFAEELHGSIGVTYDSKYIWRGFDIYGDKSAIHPFVDLDLFGTGFGINVTAHRANSSGYENSERWDYTIYYRNRAFEDKVYAMDYMFAYRYYNYPDNTSHKQANATGTYGSVDLQEVHGLFSWPNILQVEGLVPRYCLVKLWPSNSGTVVGSRSLPNGVRGTASGWAHIFMLDYALKTSCPIMEGQERVFNLHSELVYNDGVHPGGGRVDHDWSNMVFGISTNFDLGNSLAFIPGVYHQITFDDSVNDDKDESWVSLAVMYSF